MTARTEPVAIGGTILGLIQATLAALVGFGAVHWSTVQIGLILALSTSLIATVTAVARSRVTPVAAPTTTVPLAQTGPTT